jgi:hypothetical protein
LKVTDVSVGYTLTAIDARLGGTVAAIDSGGGPGALKLYAGALLLSTIPLAFPCGNVAAGVLTFFPGGTDPAAAGTGLTTEGRMTNSLGVEMVTGLTVGAPGDVADVIVTNGVGTTLIAAGQVVTLLSAKFQGA